MTSSAIVLPGQDTLVASWAALARHSPDARVICSSTTSAAVFPAWSVLNNAIVTGADPDAAAADVSSIFAAAGADTWALWLPSRHTYLAAPDRRNRVAELTRDATTLVMHASLRRELPSHPGVRRTSIWTAIRATDEIVPAAEIDDPREPDPFAGWVMTLGGDAVVGAWSFLHGTDCGVYTVGTAPQWRRRGLARTLVQHVLADAVSRGARTATLQSTPMAIGLYRSLGFRPAGRYEEWLSQPTAVH